MMKSLTITSYVFPLSDSTSICRCTIRLGDYRTIAKREHIIAFRVTDKEKRQIEEKAEIKYNSVSAFARDCTVNKDIIVLPGITEFAEQLRAIGNNLNQLTRAVNSGKATVINLTEMCEEVAEIWQSLNSDMQVFL